MLLQNGLYDPSQFGQGGFGGGPMSMGSSPMQMGGPSGFAGDMPPPPGGGMFGAPPQQQQKKSSGLGHILPYLALGLLGGSLFGGGGGMGLPSMLLGGLGGFGLSKSKVF